MKLSVLLLPSIVLMLLIFSCTPEPKEPSPGGEVGSGKEKMVAETQQDWQKEWKKLVAEATRDGRMIVYSSLGSDQRIPLVDAFKESFGLPLEFIAGRGEEVAVKMLAERRGGLYLADAYIGGPTTIYNVFKRHGFLMPLEPELILPEVKDPSLYWQKRLPFSDAEGKYVFSFIATVSGGDVAINTNHINREELTSYYDLLAPKFKGKIVMQDPTTVGKGNTWFMKVMAAGKTLDVDYMKNLAKQEPVIIRDRRQQIESLARGKFWISIANQSSTLEEFIKLGTPVAEVRLKEDIDAAFPGSGNVVLIDKAPHPRAAKVFINWLLTKEVQTIFARASKDQSARIDVPTDHLSSQDVRNPNVVYFQEDEKYLLEASRYLEVSREIFGPLLK